MHHSHHPFAFRGRTTASLSLALGLAISSIALAGPQAPGPQAAAAAQTAAAAPATLDGILKELATWDGGIESGAVWKLRAWIEARKDDAAGRAECEAKLLAFLKSPTATAPARMAASRSLRPFAGDSAVPALQALMADDRTFDTALFVLQQMPGPAAEKALLTPADHRARRRQDVGHRRPRRTRAIPRPWQPSPRCSVSPTWPLRQPAPSARSAARRPPTRSSPPTRERPRLSSR